MKLYEILRMRAFMFLKEAEDDLRKGFYDLAAFHSEQALQLFLKSMLVRLSGEEVREVRELLATLAFTLEVEGFGEQSRKIAKLAKEYRRALIELEEAYYEARYKPATYSKEEASELVETAKAIIERLKEIEGELWPSP